MTLPENPPHSKRSRLWLFAPFAILVLAALALLAAWFWMRGEVFRRMDVAAAAAGQTGYQVDWRARSISRYALQWIRCLRRAAQRLMR